jgi:hypothetical protein
MENTWVFRGQTCAALGCENLNPARCILRALAQLPDLERLNSGLPLHMRPARAINATVA